MGSIDTFYETSLICNEWKNSHERGHLVIDFTHRRWWRWCVIRWEAFLKIRMLAEWKVIESQSQEQLNCTNFNCINFKIRMRSEFSKISALKGLVLFIGCIISVVYYATLGTIKHYSNTNTSTTSWINSLWISVLVASKAWWSSLYIK